VITLEQKVEAALGNVSELIIANRQPVQLDEIFNKIGVKKPFDETRGGQYPLRVTCKNYLCFFFEKNRDVFISLLEAIINLDDRRIDGEMLEKINSHLSTLNYKIDIDSAGVKRVVIRDEFEWLKPWPEVHCACLAAQDVFLHKPVDWDTTCIEKMRDAFERLLKKESGSPTKSVAGKDGQIDDFVRLIVEHSGVNAEQSRTESEHLKSFYGLLSTHGTHSPATTPHAQDAEYIFAMGVPLLKWMLRRVKRIP